MRSCCYQQISELEESLKKANATLFGVKSELVDLQAANKKLRIQEEKDRQKIQHLLALTQPITEEVTYSCRVYRCVRLVYQIPPCTVHAIHTGHVLPRLSAWN